MTTTIKEFHPAIAASTVNDLQRQLDNLLAVVVAGRLMLEGQGDDADATVLGLCASTEELATSATGPYYLRYSLTAQAGG